MVVDCACSVAVPVVSGVSHCRVIGPLFSIIFIHDLGINLEKC